MISSEPTFEKKTNQGGIIKRTEISGCPCSCICMSAEIAI